MNNEKYFNYYVETLTNTLTDAIVRNVSLQASVKISEEDVKELHQTVELLDAEIGRLKEQLENERNSRNNSENSTIKELQNSNDSLRSELDSIRSMKIEYENVKHQVQHVDTFRKELLKVRNENEELKKEIEYLKLTPAKRKKLDEQNMKAEGSVDQQINTKDQIKDGGTF